MMGIYSSTLDFAIEREELLHRYYTLLARWAKTEEMRVVLTNFAQEVLQHKAKLSSLKRQKAEPPEEKIRNLKISDYMTDVKPKLEMTYEDKLVFIMKKAADSLRLYRDLAAITSDDDLRDTFLTLAQDEAKHKKRFKTECKKMAEGEKPRTCGV
jgi:rubrerythrin